MLGMLATRAPDVHLDEMKGVLKQGTPRCRRRRNACSTNLGSDPGSIRQKLPFPGSS